MKFGGLLATWTKSGQHYKQIQVPLMIVWAELPLI
jgi:hypothetical protein